MSTQCKDTTFIPIEEFNRNRQEHAQKLKPGECFWSWHEYDGPPRSTADGGVSRDIKFVGVVIGPEYKPRS